VVRKKPSGCVGWPESGVIIQSEERDDYRRKPIGYEVKIKRVVRGGREKVSSGKE